MYSEVDNIKALTSCKYVDYGIQLRTWLARIFKILNRGIEEVAHLASISAWSSLN